MTSLTKKSDASLSSPFSLTVKKKEKKEQTWGEKIISTLGVMTRKDRSTRLISLLPLAFQEPGPAKILNPHISHVDNTLPTHDEKITLESV